MNTKDILQKVKANLEKKSSAYQDYMKKFMKDKGVNMKSMNKELWKELGDGWKSKKELKKSKMRLFSQSNIDKQLKDSIQLPVAAGQDKSSYSIFNNGDIIWQSALFNGDKYSYKFISDSHGGMHLIVDKKFIRTKSFEEGFKKIEDYETGKEK